VKARVVVVRVAVAVAAE
jgi:hypothetical protein